MARTTKSVLNSRRSGVTYIETMVAASILAVGVMGVMGLYAVSFQIHMRAEDTTVTYNVAKRTIETMRANGFANVADGVTTTYYDLNGNQLPGPTAQGFQVTLNVSSDRTESSSSATRPSADATREATVTVAELPGGVVMLNAATYMVYGGS